MADWSLLNNALMDPMTFLLRVVTLPACLRVLPDFEILNFAYNRRDPDIMDLLKQHCAAINARNLRMRSGRILRVQVYPLVPTLLLDPARIDWITVRSGRGIGGAVLKSVDTAQISIYVWQS